MRYKSAVQERLESGRNRLDILRREVDFQRMPSKEVAGGLRYVGGMLESVQRMVAMDKNVKFKDQIVEKLEIGKRTLSGTIRGLDAQKITVSELGASMASIGRGLEAVTELVDLEIEDLA